MRLEWFHVREFQSVRDSGRVNVGDMACLVGKNEAGKSALFRALYRLNPIAKTDGSFSATHDYPRMHVEDYLEAVERKERKPLFQLLQDILSTMRKSQQSRPSSAINASENYEFVVSKNHENQLDNISGCGSSKSARLLS